jgi:hypothetical protein
MRIFGKSFEDPCLTIKNNEVFRMTRVLQVVHHPLIACLLWLMSEAVERRRLSDNDDRI